jgi:predicted ABC-class ATPase
MVRSAKELEALLLRIDGRGYPAYKEIAGTYDFADFTLVIDHVQGDPFADPSRVRVIIDLETASFPPQLRDTPVRCLGVRHLIAQHFSLHCQNESSNLGSGKSGLFDFDAPGQQVLEHTGVLVDGEVLEVRFRAALPADNRRIKGRAAVKMLCKKIPTLVDNALRLARYPAGALALAADTNEDAEALRALLPELGLVAFVADGAVLPRRSGVDDTPLTVDEGAVAFVSPPTLRVEAALPHAGLVAGLGIPKGVTLVVGGGFHGKSTLLNALERAVYNHRPGDGRELVVCDRSAVKVRAEDGRAITGVDISTFINNLPQGHDTGFFVTANASGSTSQAASIAEGLEAGATAILLDEDTSATNFMIRDRRMQALVAKEREPITPYIDVVRSLWEEHGISTVLVMGGSGDYFDVADTVLCLDEYRAKDVTGEAREVAQSHQTHRKPEPSGNVGRGRARKILTSSLDPRRGRREEAIKGLGTRTLLFGVEEIDLSSVEQLVHPSQVRSIGAALALIRGLGPGPLPELLDRVERLIAHNGLDALCDYTLGSFGEFRRQELAATLNRLRKLRAEPL